MKKYVMTFCMLVSQYYVIYAYQLGYTVIQKLFDRKYIIDNKVQGKLVSWIHDYHSALTMEYSEVLIGHST